MGRQQVKILATTDVSRHNSDEDERDDALVLQFFDEVTEVAKKYYERGIDISVDIEWW